MAYLILHYPLMKKLQAGGQAVRRFEPAAVNAGASVTELLVWSSHLVVCQATIPEISQEQATTPITEQNNQSKIIDHQRSVINQLMKHIKCQDERMDNLEAKMYGTSSRQKNRNRQRDLPQEQDKPKRRRGATDIAVNHLEAAEAACGLHEALKLFLDGGFELVTKAPKYHDRVLDLDKRVDEAITLNGASNVLKQLRSLHHSGILNTQIERYQRLIQTVVIKESAPGYTQDVLEVTSASCTCNVHALREGI
ncbi:hypothetical protein PHPALM_30582 [Phytophthora palmivora]|uniref:Uncharacterized protein n=1 Tax=Phytophthora palmivora TaxID=4796 RepID=A0A2P4X4U7_9STRA|nr:hypothetical protein PHPALM_30582 [Phytophthora palmivora]